MTQSGDRLDRIKAALDRQVEVNADLRTSVTELRATSEALLQVGNIYAMLERDKEKVFLALKKNVLFATCFCCELKLYQPFQVFPHFPAKKNVECKSQLLIKRQSSLKSEGHTQQNKLIKCTFYRIGLVGIRASVAQL